MFLKVKVIGGKMPYMLNLNRIDWYKELNGEDSGTLGVFIGGRYLRVDKKSTKKILKLMDSGYYAFFQKAREDLLTDDTIES